MPGVSLTVNSVIDPSSNFSDPLDGGGTGLDLGSVVNGSYAPVILQSANTGAQNVYIEHDAADFPITDVKTFIQQYGTSTGFTYGGAATAAGDYATMKTLGNASDGNPNNLDTPTKLGGGLRVDMDWDVATVNQFDWDTNGIAQGGNDSVAIYGDNNTDGIDLASAFVIATHAMVYESGGETAASSPVAGQIGKAADTVLGDNAHVKLRMYLPETHSQGGIIQFEWVIAYSFTS